MNMSFFNPERIKCAETLILIPYFPEKKYFRKNIESADRKKGILGSSLYHFHGYDILHGFLGYSYLLTLLEFIQDVRQKTVFFLGTAGSINSQIPGPSISVVSEIFPGGIFKHFADEKMFYLNHFEDDAIPSVKGMSVDIIQREDPEWLRETEKRGIRIVEMEIYPLMWYLGKKFNTLVVTSDNVTVNGINSFNRKETGEKFVEAYEMILEKLL